MISVSEPPPATGRLFAQKAPRVDRIGVPVRGDGIGMRDTTRGVDLDHSYGQGLTLRGNEERKVEKPWMRHAAHYLATGKYTMRQVADLCGVTYESLRAVSRNAWFNETINQLIADCGGNDLLERWKAEWDASMVAAVEIRDDPKTPSNTKLAAAKEIMDRVRGKSVQYVVTDNTVRSGDPVEEVAMLERQLADRAKRLGVELPALDATFVDVSEHEVREEGRAELTADSVNAREASVPLPGFSASESILVSASSGHEVRGPEIDSAVAEAVAVPVPVSLFDEL